MASGSLNTTKDKNSYPPWDEFNLIIHLMQNFLDILGFENTQITFILWPVVPFVSLRDRAYASNTAECLHWVIC